MTSRDDAFISFLLRHILFLTFFYLLRPCSHEVSYLNHSTFSPLYSSIELWSWRQGNEFPLAVFREIIRCCGLHNLPAWQGSKTYLRIECSFPNRRFGALEELKQAKRIESSSGSRENSWGCNIVSYVFPSQKCLEVKFTQKTNTNYQRVLFMSGSKNITFNYGGLVFFFFSFTFTGMCISLWPLPSLSPLPLLLRCYLPSRFCYHGHLLDHR